MTKLLNCTEEIFWLVYVDLDFGEMVMMAALSETLFMLCADLLPG